MTTISYTPFANTASMQFDVDDVNQVYKGQLNCCRCGCAGDYWKPGDAEFLEQFQLALKHFEAANAREVKGEVWDKERYLEVQTHESYNGTAMEFEEYGYAIYLKK